jgi:hypothetical protein
MQFPGPDHAFQELKGEEEVRVYLLALVFSGEGREVLVGEWEGAGREEGRGVDGELV